MELIGRTDELAALGRLFDQSRKGRGSVAVIQGPLGSGKTTLLRAFADQATTYTDAVLLSATASRAEQSIPFAAIDQLAQSGNLPHLAECIARLSDRDTGEGAVPYPEDSEGIAQLAAPVSRALCETLRELARKRPVIIEVDDAHLTDQPSIYCLLYAVRRLRSAPVLTVFSGCFDSQQGQELFQAEIMRLPNCRQIPLNPLSVNAIEALLAEHMDAEAAHRLAPNCHRVSGGSPLLVRALVEDWAAAGKPDRSVVGDAFGRAVVGCLHRGDPVLIELADVLAIAGDWAPLPLLAGLLGLDEESAAQAVNAFQHSGPLEADQFAQASVRKAMLSRISPEARKAMHSRAALLLQDEGASAIVVARHLVAGAGIPAWAGPVLLKAAEQALIGGDVGAAVEYLVPAHRICTDERERCNIASLLSCALWQLNPASVTRYLPELVAAVEDRHISGWDAALVLGHLLWHGWTAEAVHVLRFLLADTEHMPHSVGMPWIDFLQMWLPCFYPGFVERLAHDEDEVVALAVAKNPIVSSRVPQRRAAIALESLLAGSANEEVVAEAEQILYGTKLRSTTALPIMSALFILIYSDELGKALFWCESLRKEMADQQAPAFNALLATTQSAIHYRRGEPAESAAEASRALSLISPEGWGAGIVAPLAFLVLSATAMGDYSLAQAYLRMRIPDAAFETLGGPYYLSARGNYHLALGEFSAALRDFESCGALMQKWGFDSPVVVQWRTDAAKVYLDMGMADRAETLVREQLVRLGPRPSRARGITLRVQAAVAEIGERLPLLREAADIFTKCEDRLELARTLADLSQVYRAQGDQRKADATARRAHDLAGLCGIEPRTLSAALVPGSAGAPGGAEPSTVLSDAEKKVAVLAAKGLTNRKIARTLFITESTVEQHLTRIYRKLPISHRSELSSRLQIDSHE